VDARAIARRAAGRRGQAGRGARGRRALGRRLYLEALRHLLFRPFAEELADDGEAEVDAAGDSARGDEVVAVPHHAVGDELEVLAALAHELDELVAVRPVRVGAPALQGARLGQEERTGADRRGDPGSVRSVPDERHGRRGSLLDAAPGRLALAGAARGDDDVEGRAIVVGGGGLEREA